MEKEPEKLTPLYFHWREIPKCAYYDFDDLTTNYRIDDQEGLADANLLFPKNLPISAEEIGPKGYEIRTRYSPLITIVSSDPTAALGLNGWKIFLGAGSFTFPTCCLGAVSFRLFHIGNALVEYRAIPQRYADDLKDVQFNFIFQDLDKKDVIGGCRNLITAQIKTPLISSTEDTYRYHSGSDIPLISRLKEAGLLFDAP